MIFTFCENKIFTYRNSVTQVKCHTHKNYQINRQTKRSCREPMKFRLEIRHNVSVMVCLWDVDKILLVGVKLHDKVSVRKLNTILDTHDTVVKIKCYVFSWRWSTCDQVQNITIECLEWINGINVTIKTFWPMFGIEHEFERKKNSKF